MFFVSYFWLIGHQTFDAWIIKIHSLSSNYDFNYFQILFSDTFFVNSDRLSKIKSYFNQVQDMSNCFDEIIAFSNTIDIT